MAILAEPSSTLAVAPNLGPLGTFRQIYYKKWSLRLVNSRDGRALDIMLSDPWDFVTDHGSGPLRCYWVAIECSESDSSPVADYGDSRKIYARLVEPMLIAGSKCEYVQISRRYAHDSIDGVFEGAKVSAGFVFSPTLEEAREPWNPSQAPRAAIGSVSLNEDEGHIS